MTSIEWSADSERFLLALDVDDAEMLLDAMERFTTSGRGFVRQMLDGHGTFGLYVSNYVVLFVRDAVGDIQVLSIRRRGREK